MEVLYARCCGLDVHKPSITACVLITQAGKLRKHIRRFGSTTRELREPAAWLREFEVEHVAMESTGVYWKPVWNVLKGQFRSCWPMHSTSRRFLGANDTKDCQWIAELLQHGLLRAGSEIYLPRFRFVQPGAIASVRTIFAFPGFCEDRTGLSSDCTCVSMFDL